MKHRDFHAGQSALGLMTRNTEAMLAPRMAQWEAFGKGLQDANAIIQNRHAFNEQLAQNQKQNEFKEREFGFQQRQAEESKRQFDTQMQEDTRRFNQSHALARQNSLYDNRLKESQAALNYWRMSEEKNKEKGKITLKTQELDRGLGDVRATLDAGKRVVENSTKIRGDGTLSLGWLSYGTSRLVNEKFSGFSDLSDDKAEFRADTQNFMDGFNKSLYKNNLSREKINQTEKRFNSLYTGGVQNAIEVAKGALDILTKEEENIINYLSSGLITHEKAMRKINEYAEDRKYFEKVLLDNGVGVGNNKEPTIQKMPTTKELESYLK